MNDREFLIWIHEKLEDVHGEKPTLDYMHKLRAIIKNTPKNKVTPNISTFNSIDDLKSDLAKDCKWIGNCAIESSSSCHNNVKCGEYECVYN